MARPALLALLLMGCTDEVPRFIEYPVSLWAEGSIEGTFGGVRNFASTTGTASVYIDASSTTMLIQAEDVAAGQYSISSLYVEAADRDWLFAGNAFSYPAGAGPLATASFSSGTDPDVTRMVEESTPQITVTVDETGIRDQLRVTWGFSTVREEEFVYAEASVSIAEQDIPQP
jgi:hypothetical protein